MEQASDTNKSAQSPSPENPATPNKSKWSYKPLRERIRALGIEPPVRRTSTSQEIDIKLEDNRSVSYAIMVPNLNLEQVTYFQPEISYDENSPERIFFKISQKDKSHDNSRISRISDIKIKSYRPKNLMKYRKKRRPSVISQVEQILNQYKEKPLSKEPSEESLEYYMPEREIHINDFPESVLQKIFLNFTLKERILLLSRVCKSWYYILKEPMFWDELEFRGDKVEEETIFNLIRRYPTMKKLSLTFFSNAVSVLQELCRCNNSITHLSVKLCDVHFLDFSRILHRVIACCKDIEVLNLKGMSFQSEGFYLELGRLRNLRSINLSGNKMLKNQDLITLSINCRNLEELKILDISLNNEQDPPLRDEDLTFIMSHLQPKLQTLKLDMQQLRNVSYQAVLKCSNLTTLGLKNCLYLSSEVFRQFQVLHKLKKFKLTRGINIKSEDFQYVFSHGNFNKLEILDIEGCWGVGEEGLRAIAQGSPSLKSLSLKNCKSIEGRHLMHLLRCPKLSDIDLSFTGIESHQLPSLYQYVKGLQTLVIDTGMYKQATVRQLKRFYPALNIIISYSEFQKDEEHLDM